MRQVFFHEYGVAATLGAGGRGILTKPLRGVASIGEDEAGLGENWGENKLRSGDMSRSAD